MPPVSSRWITDAELEANPGLVKTMSVKPPMGTGRVRLIEIAGLDLQPCGGTHVRATGEIGAVRVTQIEKEGQTEPPRAACACLVALTERLGDCAHWSRSAHTYERRTPSSRWLKSTEWLAGQLGKPDVAIVDGSYYLPTQKRDAKAEYLAAHIPGAVFFDINAIADDSTDLPHMLPGPDQFGEAAGALGISENDTIVDL